jgi:hypothetical protein
VIPDLVIRHGRGRDGKPVEVSREEIAAASFDGKLPGRPDLLVGDRVAESALAQDGELPGTRTTIDMMIRQEIAGGCDPKVAEAQVRRVAASYDRSVRQGTEAYPLRRD